MKRIKVCRSSSQAFRSVKKISVRVTRWKSSSIATQTQMQHYNCSTTARGISQYTNTSRNITTFPFRKRINAQCKDLPQKRPAYGKRRALLQRTNGHRSTFSITLRKCSTVLTRSHSCWKTRTKYVRSCMTVTCINSVLAACIATSSNRLSLRATRTVESSRLTLRSITRICL